MSDRSEDFGGFCEECGARVQARDAIDGLCPACAGSEDICPDCRQICCSCEECDEDDEWDLVNGLNPEPCEPEDEDLITSDHENFFEKGAGGFPSPVVKVPEGEDWRPHVKAWMEGRSYFPNVWFISDDGNAHLMSWEDE